MIGKIAQLFGCVNDATEFKTIIETNGDGAPNFDVRLETNVKTRSDLMTMIKEVFEGDVDTSLLYYSGHGYLNDLGGFLVTPDAKKNDEGISMTDLLKIAENSDAKNKIIILDCCHAGAMGLQNISGSKTVQLTSGLSILTACRDVEKSYEVKGHGVFTNLLLEGLKGGAADIRGNITPGSIYSYIDQALGVWDHQRPMFKTNITQFTVLRSVTPQVELSTLRNLIKYFPSASDQFDLDPEYEYTDENSKPEKVRIFKDLQKYEGVGLVVPNGEEHMYWAAINNKSCSLTALGYHYWRLIKDKRF